MDLRTISHSKIWLGATPSFFAAKMGSASSLCWMGREISCNKNCINLFLSALDIGRKFTKGAPSF